MDLICSVIHNHQRSYNVSCLSQRHPQGSQGRWANEIALGRERGLELGCENKRLRKEIKRSESKAEMMATHETMDEQEDKKRKTGSQGLTHLEVCVESGKSQEWQAEH